MASLVLDICTNAANKPIKNCSIKTSASLNGNNPPESASHPANTASQVAKQNVSTGLLPNRSSREPKNHKLLNPPKNAVDVTSKIFPSAIPASAFRNATVNAVIPP